MNDLFRHEAVFHATRRRLSGSVVLATPLSVRCLGLVLGRHRAAGADFRVSGDLRAQGDGHGMACPRPGPHPGHRFLRRIHPERRGQGRRPHRTGCAARGDPDRRRYRHRQCRRAGHGSSCAPRREAARAKAQTADRAARCRIQAGARAPGKAPRRVAAGADPGRIAGQAACARPRGGRRAARRLAARGLLALRERDARRRRRSVAEQDMAGPAPADCRHRARHRRYQRADVGHRHGEGDRRGREPVGGSEPRAAHESTPRRGGCSSCSSPVAGRVAALPVAVGQPVSPGGTVAVVIPEGAKLEAELLAPSRAAGFIRPGQDVRLMLQAFPYQRFGTVKGEIKTISHHRARPDRDFDPGPEDQGAGVPRSRRAARARTSRLTAR